MYASLAVLALLVSDPQQLGCASTTVLTSGVESSPYDAGDGPMSRSTGMSDWNTSSSLVAESM